MLITKTPLRISFVGGGSDISTFYRIKRGSVVSMAINKYFYLSIHPNFKKNGLLLKYSKTEDIEDVNKIEHRIIREVFKKYNISNADFSSAADVPAGTGLGSSSSFTVSLLHLIHTYQNRYINQSNLAKEACNIEIDALKEPIGKQDQYGCALGGLKLIKFNVCKHIQLNIIILKKIGL